MDNKNPPIEDMNLIESDFEGIDTFKPTSFQFIFFCLLINVVAPVLLLISSVEYEFQIMTIVLFAFTLLIYFFIMLQFNIPNRIFRFRLFFALHFYRENPMEYGPRTKQVYTDPEYDPSIISTISIGFFLFIVESIISLRVWDFLTGVFPNPNIWLFILYLIGFFLLSYIFMTLLMGTGIISSYRSLNYYCESFYSLKAILQNKKKKGLFKYITHSFSSFSTLLKLNEISIDFQYNKIDYLGNMLHFFKPEDDLIATTLMEEVYQILLQLKNHEWFKIIKGIENLEINLKQSLDSLESSYINGSLTQATKDTSNGKLDMILVKQLRSSVVKISKKDIIQIIIFSCLTVLSLILNGLISGL